MGHHGVILLAHGSRDPQWRQSIEAVAARMAQIAPDVPVGCAYLELCEPTLAAAAAELVAQQAAAVSVVPMFLGMGKHAREDIPRLIDEVRLNHPGVTWSLRPAIGEHPAMIDLMASLACNVGPNGSSL